MEIIENLIIGDTKYPLSNFSEAVQNLVSFRSLCAEDAKRERLALAKTEAAIRGLDLELAGLVQTELETKANDPEFIASKEND